MLYTVIYINKMVDKLLVIYYDKVHELRVFIFCHRCIVKRVSVNGVNSNAVGGFWAANCGFCRKCFAKCDNVFEENVGVRNDETEN